MLCMKVVKRVNTKFLWGEKYFLSNLILYPYKIMDGH